jgi:L-ascorbate metabolism protein UlaG (beta-lactamase superfamily)
VSLLAPARRVADLARFAATRPAREREDAAALRALRQTPLGLPPGMELEWLGVAGYRLTYEGRTLLIDPYLSRVPLRAMLGREPALPDAALLARFLPDALQVEGVLVGHTHFDHAVDAPAIARRFGCSVLGSGSLVTLMGLHGLHEQAVEVEPYHRYELGPFTVSFVPSAHSKLVLGLAVPMDGELTCAHLDGLSPRAYRCGQVWGIHVEVGGRTFYHQGSADLVDDAVRHRGVDVFLAGIAGRGFARDYWRRILPRLDPAVVVPSHFDDFFRPADAPLGFTLNVNLAAVPEEVAAVSRDVAVATLAPPSGAVAAGQSEGGGPPL